MNGTKIVYRTEQIWLPPNDIISHLCHLSKNLYNQANYIIKNTEQGNWIRYADLDKIFNGKGTNPSENYKQLPSGTAQHILILVDKTWKGFFSALKSWQKNPEKFHTRPKPPNYKKKDGEYILPFTNSKCKIKNGFLKFPKKVGIKVKTKLSDNTDLREIRVIPKGIGYVCEIVYKKEIELKEKNKDRIVGIDFGSKNIIAMVNNIGKKPIVVQDNGKDIKSINQFYNKRKAELRSIYDRQGIKDGVKMQQLKTKRHKKVNDWIHKLTRLIIDWCIRYEIGTIVVGYNINWKQKIKLGRRNNQNFVSIAFDRIIQKLTYKAEEQSIEIKEQEESHTSKCSFLDDESITHHNNYAGKRIRRGLFKSKMGIIINADVNAGYNIIKKAIPKAFSNGRKRIGGCALHPLIVGINYKEENTNV